jgi:hypothetical protein
MNELYHAKTADVKYDSITCATRHQPWMNVPSCHIERHPEITIVQPTPSILSLTRRFTTCSSQNSPKPTFILCPISRSIISYVLYMLYHCPFLISVWCMPLRSVYRIRDRLHLVPGYLRCVRRRTTPADTRSTLQISPSNSYQARSLFAYQPASLVKSIQWKSF